MLLLHTLSRLAFTDQEWKPLLAGFLLHYAACEGYKPRLKHCVTCEKRIEDGEHAYFDMAEGGLCCESCHKRGQTPLAQAQIRWMREKLLTGSATWVNEQACYAPYTLLRTFVEQRVGVPLRAASMLPKD